MDESTRARLLQAKLVGAVRSRGGEPGDPRPVQGGAAVQGAGTCWVLVQDEPERAVGKALAWAARNGGGTPTCIVDVDHGGAPQAAAASVAARKGSALATPVPVWWVEGSTVHDAEPAPPEPTATEPSAAAAPWLEVAAAVGLDAVVYADGSLSMEVLGLEVGRVGADGTVAVGAGRHDREATAEVWAGEPGREALVRAAESVRIERRADRVPTLASTLQRERWLRRSLVADPSRIGLDALVPLPEGLPPADLRRPRPSGAVTPDGATLVVCSVGADLDAVPCTADLLRTRAPQARQALLVVPPGDDHPITRDLLVALPVPATLSAVAPPWAQA